MNFRRIKVKGQNRKVRKTWKSEDGYRVVWRREFMGISLPPAFHACVRIHLPSGWEMWDFVERRGLYKTFKAASEACDSHQRLWQSILQASGVRRILELCGSIPLGYPLWARKTMNGKIRAILENADRPRGNECNNQNDPPEILPTIESSKPGEPRDKSGRVLSVTDGDGDTIQPINPTLLKDTDTSDNSLVSPAEVPARGRKRRSSKRTARKSPGTGKKKKSTKRLSKPKKLPLQN